MVEDLKVIKQQIKTTIVYGNPFGDMCVFDMPDDCNIVILAVNKGFGLRPVSLCLPGQVYVETIQKLLEEHQAKEIVAIPASSDNYISIIGEV